MKMNLCRVVGALLVVGMCLAAQSVGATDYFITIGGGYSSAGNQASLEANVLFYQRILREKHPGPRVHNIFFADGTDPAEDLQVEAEAESNKPVRPATELIATLHRRGDRLGAGFEIAITRSPTSRGRSIPNWCGRRSSGSPRQQKTAID